MKSIVVREQSTLLHEGGTFLLRRGELAVAIRVFAGTAELACLDMDLSFPRP